MENVRLIRHGESAANAGEPTITQASFVNKAPGASPDGRPFPYKCSRLSASPIRVVVRSFGTPYIACLIIGLDFYFKEAMKCPPYMNGKSS